MREQGKSEPVMWLHTWLAGSNWVGLYASENATDVPRRPFAGVVAMIEEVRTSMQVRTDIHTW